MAAGLGAAGVLAAVRHGGTAFEQVYGDRFFDYPTTWAGTRTRRPPSRAR
ncbi:MAG TPA: hypothetical protein VK713_00280 [Actinomycetes bacterium]|nr:hypothetical protein [Actinomycetes bacterium]